MNFAVKVEKPTSFATSRWPTADALIREPESAATRIPEAVVQHIWRNKLYRLNALFTTDGLPVVVENPGSLNTGFGPDFLNARVRIDTTMWCGAVEIHKFSSDWWTHRHHTDPNYDTVVLHVTLIADKSTACITRSDGTVVPEVVLYPLLASPLRSLIYDFYLKKKTGLPCASAWPYLEKGVVEGVLERYGRRRIRRRADGYRHHDDLEQVLFEQIFRSLGYRPNADAMQGLAGRLTVHEARQLAAQGSLTDHLFKLAEFGVHDRSLTYPALPAGPQSGTGALLWTTSSVRPANHPKLRIAQGAHLFSRDGLLGSSTIPRLLDALSAPDALSKLHRLLRPGRAASPAAPVPAIGTQRARVIISNAILPLALHLAARHQNPSLRKDVWTCYERIRSEPDAVTRKFPVGDETGIGAVAHHGMHGLYISRCAQTACLACPVATAILRRSGEGR